MWFGTGSGLNRYDGRTFKVFRMPGISYRRIDRVVSLDTDYLLLRSEQNLFLFDKKYERFLPVCDSVSKQPVMFADFVADSDGSCWGVSSGELSEVNFPSSFVQDTAFVSVRHVVNNSQSDPFVVLCMGEDGKMLYCASRNGTVYRFTPGQRQLKKVCDGQLSSGRWVSSLLNDDSFIWIPTVGDGLYGYDLTNGKLHHWQYISERMGEQLSHNDVFRLLPIGNSRYLAVTWNGYTLLSLTPERAIKLRDFQSFIHNGKQLFRDTHDFGLLRRGRIVVDWHRRRRGAVFRTCASCFITSMHRPVPMKSVASRWTKMVTSGWLRFTRECCGARSLLTYHIRCRLNRLIPAFRA